MSDVLEAIEWRVVGGSLLFAFCYAVLMLPAAEWPLVPVDLASVVKGVATIWIVLGGAAAFLVLERREQREAGS